MDLGKLCMEALRIAREAGAFIQKEAKDFTAKSVEYKGKNNLVSYVDKKAEDLIVEALTPLVQGAGFIAEEDSERFKGEKYNWIIDPLDGTTNFVHGIPVYSTCIALMKDDDILLGVVYEMNLNECFYAWKGGGAWLNGSRIKVSETAELSKALMATGFPYYDYELMKEYMNVFEYCMRNTHGIRRLGSAAVDIAYVACGRFEGFYEYGLNAWDVAAGVCIVKEAGGKISDFSGGNNYIFGREIITSNAGTFNEFLKVVKKEFKKDHS
ncbi:MAG: inositol monophosphatase family protein [Bacteroidia bacterium]